MSKLDEYAKIVELKREFLQNCVRKSGRFSLLPTNKGGIIFNFGPNKEIQDISPKELTEIRDLIDCFLKEVVK